jgi:hypothetical protein
MCCKGCGSEIGEHEQAVEVCCSDMYCVGCAIPLTPAMKRFVDDDAMAKAR